MLKIHIDSLVTDTILCDENFALWGNIHISINNICFPDDEWSDAVSSILDMWTAGILEFVSKNKKHCILHFMDGPFLLKLSKIEGDYIAIACIDGNNKEQASTILSTSELLQSFLDGTLLFINLCRRTAPHFTNSQIFKKISNAYYKLKNMEKTGDGSVVP